jgi:hypothetical protein
MTDQILQPQRFAELGSNFSIGNVFNRTFSILTRNVLPFGLVALVASLPHALTDTARIGLEAARTGAVAPDIGKTGFMLLFGGLGTMILGAISQAAILYGAFDDMRGRPVDLVESLRVGLRRFFPLIGVVLLFVVFVVLSAVALLFPAFIVMTMLYVSIPACVVERLGPIKSLGRSARLTKGHRWKIFGLVFATLIVAVMVQSMLGSMARAAGGPTLAIIVLLLWTTVWNAFQAILTVVTYHDLRVAKEGVDTDQIAAVFD